MAKYLPHVSPSLGVCRYRNTEVVRDEFHYFVTENNWASNTHANSTPDLPTLEDVDQSFQESVTLAKLQ